jgi:glycosyltransferase involved in cell wall biosynthesis
MAGHDTGVGRPRTAAVIAAYNEEVTVADVVHAAAASPLVDEVIVVDGGSQDETAQRAGAAGARVVRRANGGKGEAMAAGVAATDAGIVVFLDADLTGLRPYHVDRLVRTVSSGGAAMACGLFDRGPLLNRVFLHLLPILTGERAVRRELFESLEPEDIAGYRIEAALNSRVGELGLPVAAFVCAGMWHRTKEEKLGAPVLGFVTKVAMLLTAVGSYLRFWVRHRLRRSSWAGPRQTSRVAALSLTSPDATPDDQAGSRPGAVNRAPGPSSFQRSTGRSPSQSSS